LNTLGMERGFLSQKGSKVGRGVKEKRDGVSPSMTVETMGSTSTGNAPGMSSYANVTGNTPGIRRSKYGLVKSMLNSSTGLFMFQFTSMDVLNAMLENGPWSSYARAIIELWSNEELKDTIMVAMPRITGGKECPKYIGVGVANNLKNPSQTSRGVSVGLEVGFKPYNNIDLFLKRLLLTLAVIRRKVWNLLMRKYENLIIDRQAILMDEDGDPINRDSYGNDDYDDNPYDDDMYEGQDIFKELQTICDNLDI
nr:hypothetical protein [Tanacetum cinerariifolium]